MVKGQSPAPTSLDGVLAEADAAERLERLSAYISNGEQQLERARHARADAVRTLREGGVTWPELVRLAGISESYLRRELQR